MVATTGTIRIGGPSSMTAIALLVVTLVVIVAAIRDVLSSRAILRALEKRQTPEVTETPLTLSPVPVVPEMPRTLEPVLSQTERLAAARAEALTTEYRQALAVPYWTWTPAMLRAAESAANVGNLLFAADLCEYLMGDDRIKAVVDTRTGALVASPLAFIPAGPGRQGTVAARALEAEDDWFAAVKETEEKALFAWVHMLGIGLAENVWVRRGKRLIPVLKTWHPRWLRYDYLHAKWILRVADDTGIAIRDLEITPGDGKWVLITAQGSDRPWVQGAWRALSRWTLLKQYALRDWAFFSETHGQTTRVLTKAPPDKKLRDQLVADLRAIGRAGIMAFPGDTDMKLLEATASEWSSFKAQIEAADTASAIAILGQNLTTQAVSGASGTAHVHRAVAETKRREDAETESTAFRDQVLAYWALFNYGNADLAPWPVRDTSVPEDEQSRATALQARSQALVPLVTSRILTVNEARELLDHDPVPEGNVFADWPKQPDAVPPQAPAEPAPAAPPPPEQTPPEPPPAEGNP